MTGIRTRILPIAAALAITLGGCAPDLSSFSITDLNPLKGNDPLASADYNYFYKRDRTATSYVSASDLIGPDGRCAFSPAATAAPGAPEPMVENPAAPINPRSNQALYFTAGPETGRTGASQAALPPQLRSVPGGIAVGMTECQVVQAAGSTARVEIGANERGQRSVTLAYATGTNAGIYRFVSGRLVSMERVDEPPQSKKTAKSSNTAKAKKPPRQ